MIEMVLNTNTLPEPLSKLMHAEKVRVRETDGIINLIPIAQNINDCPLHGIAAGSSLTVEKFLNITHDKTEME